MESMADNTSWWQCADGRPIEPIEVFLLSFFPHANTSDWRNNCYTPIHYKAPLLESVLPARDPPFFLTDDLIDILNVLFRCCLLVIAISLLWKYVWEYFDPNFNKIRPHHKKWYVIANLIKAIMLCLLTVNRGFWKELYNITQDNFQLLQIKRGCAIYLVPDIVALFLVPKLPTTTLIHHVTTIAGGFLVFVTDIEVKSFFGVFGFVKMGLWYGSLSALAFPVNAYLGLRVVYSQTVWFMKGLCFFSLLIYSLVCIVNWIYHSTWLYGVISHRDYSFFSILYFVFFFLIVSDDIILMRWLLRKSSPLATDNYNIKKQN